MGLTLFTPHLRVDSVLELTPERLAELGLGALLVDVDCTLKRYPNEHVEPGVTDWLAALKARGIAVCLVSNGRHGRISRLAGRLDVPFIARAGKPLPGPCSRAVRRLGVEGARAAMVGDQIFADVLAGRLAGLYTILVRPIHPEEERWWTRVKRPAERWVLRRLEGKSRM